jgi:multidrug efflux pump subunit AcrA (membrane-fusion protein)
MGCFNKRSFKSIERLAYSVSRWLIPALLLCSIASAQEEKEPVKVDSERNEQAEASNVQPKGIEVVNALTRTRELVEISAEIAGPIVEMVVSEGSRIKVSQTLGRIKDERARMARDKAKLELELAEEKKSSDIAVRLTDKASKVAQAEYERAVNANKQIANTYPESEVDRRKLVFEKSQLEIEQAAYDRSLTALQASIAVNQVEQAEFELSRHTLLSPINGMVVGVKRHQGEWVEPGTPILEVVDLDHFRVEGFVTAEEAAVGLFGKSVSIDIAIGNVSLARKGKVVFASPEANPVNMQVRVIIEAPFGDDEARNRFRSGLKCRAVIEMDDATDSERKGTQGEQEEASSLQVEKQDTIKEGGF